MTEATTAAPPGQFVFVTCQVGAEPALKADVARHWPQARLAFSRPGFLTFKMPEEAERLEMLRPLSVLARSQGRSLFKVSQPNLWQLPQKFWELAAPYEFDRLHVWQRDTATPGHHEFEPSHTALAKEIEAQLRGAYRGKVPLSAAPTQMGERVLDCIVVEPNELWAGIHVAGDQTGCWPGGIPDLNLPAQAVSRAWLKMEEALEWLQPTLHPGDRVAEIGCAPGGASQALLDRGLRVLGIDPAEVDPLVAAHRHFTHLRKRGADVRRREFAGMRLLTSDINVAPTYTLDTVEAIVKHAEVDIPYLLLTLKLLEWQLVAEVPQYVSRVQSWGYRDIRVRQLAHNRQELCLLASKTPRRRAISVH